MILVSTHGPTDPADPAPATQDRYGRKATIIASRPCSPMAPTINEPTLADAIMDRLTAAAHKFELKGPSKRQNIKII
ncbi:MAG: ATP-binding protein [Haliscomenobacter sp.]|nr:ATP-binding protein [Haliscomenobacter sp.]